MYTHKRFDPRFHSRPMYILSYVATHGRIYIADKDFNVHGYSLSLDFIEYQSAILRDDLDAAATILPQIPVQQHNKVAHFLASRSTCFPSLTYL